MRQASHGAIRDASRGATRRASRTGNRHASHHDASHGNICHRYATSIHRELPQRWKTT
jgi:hypothetical protein